MKRHALLTTLFLFASTLVSAQEMQTSVKGRNGNVLDNGEGTLRVNNRVLINLNGKPISVMDVVKKMDPIFDREYPQYANSSRAKYEFYTNSWRPVLRDIIDKELILSDAHRMDMTVTNGEIRQEMNDMFGPNVMKTLSDVGMSFEEAWDLVKTDMIVRRMMMVRVNMKAISKLHPKDIRNAYEAYVAKHPATHRWVYRVATIRDSDAKRGAEIANALERQLESASDLQSASAVLAERGLLAADTSLKVSEEYHHEESAISPDYHKVLSSLDIGTHSTPIAQKSRATGSTVYRIFHVIDKVEETPPSLAELEEELKGQLIQNSIAKETDAYIEKLHRDFMLQDHVLNELIPPTLQPFTIN